MIDKLWQWLYLPVQSTNLTWILTLGMFVNLFVRVHKLEEKRK